MAVAGHECTEAEVVIDVLVAVDVVDFAGFAVLDENWIRFVVAIVAGDTEGDIKRVCAPLRILACAFRKWLVPFAMLRA
jgi:hypothetical protein